MLLYHLQRHSDHHANPTRRYQALRHFDDAPQLPTGYAGMIVLALVPAVWRRVMDPRLLAHYDGDVDAREHPAAGAQARPGALRSRGMSALPLPGLRLRLRRGAGNPREGFPPGTPWCEVPDDWHCPDCGVDDKVDFEPSE